ncbi:hypothetical protein H4R20_000425 [Coemansia guatemalensis]|uniref:Uncharacterized protein n=1 Tax=Coemansia guatemalensis TaxID=2761395 RepID=A0A9W8LWN1_9FUNG|nr:hypothetical protein H4R20_000425 [Coemansia guatemalensis]
MGRSSRNARKANAASSIAAPNIQIAGAKKHQTTPQPAPSAPPTERSPSGISIAGAKAASAQNTKPTTLPTTKAGEGISIATTKHIKKKQEEAPAPIAPASKSTAAGGIAIAGKSKVQNGEQQKQQKQQRPKSKQSKNSTVTKQTPNSSSIDIAGSTSTKPKQQQQHPHQQPRKQQHQQSPRHAGNSTATAPTPTAAFSEGIAISGASSQDSNPSKHKKKEEPADKQPLTIKRRKSMSRDSSPAPPMVKRRSLFGAHFERAILYNNGLRENSSDSMESESSSAQPKGSSAVAADANPVTQSTAASVAPKDANKAVPQQLHNIKQSQRQRLRERRLSDPVKMHRTQQDTQKRQSINQRVKIPIDKHQVRYVVPMAVLGVQEQLPMHVAQSMSNGAYLGAIQPGTENTHQSPAAPRAKKKNKKPATRDCGVTACIMEPQTALSETAMDITAIDSPSNSAHAFGKSPEQATTSTAGSSSFVGIQNSPSGTRTLGYTQEQRMSISVQDEVCSDIEMHPAVDFGDFDEDMDVQ